MLVVHPIFIHVESSCHRAMCQDFSFDLGLISGYLVSRLETMDVLCKGHFVRRISVANSWASRRLCWNTSFARWQMNSWCVIVIAARHSVCAAPRRVPLLSTSHQ